MTDTSFLSELGLSESNQGAAIGSQWIKTSGEEITSYSPVDGKAIGKVVLATTKEYDQVIDAANEAFKEVEYEVDENTDLTQPPEYDNVLDEIEKVVMGELKLKEEGGEVVNINAWKPEIVKD